MLGDALDYPTAGDSGPPSLLLGGFLVGFRAVALFAVFVFYPVGESAIESWPLTAVSVLVLLLFELPLRGYRVRALRATARDPEADAPSFRPVASLFRDGAGGLVVYVVYLLPAVLLGLLAVGGNATAAIQDPSAAFARGVARNVAGLALLFGLLYLLGMTYVLPAAVTNFAHEERVRAAFRLRRVFDGAFSEDYGVAWLVSVLFQAIAYPVSLFLWTLLVGPFVQFFVAVATRYLWGHGYGRALGLEPRTADDVARLDEDVPRSSGEPAGTESAPDERDWATGGPEPATEPNGGGDTSPRTDTSDDADDDEDPMASEFDR